MNGSQFDDPGTQFAVWDTVEERIVRKLDPKDVYSWAQDYEAGNSRNAVITREVPRWIVYSTREDRR